VSKYLQIIRITFQEYFEYRLNFVMWRFRNLISFLTLIIFWLAIYGEKDKILDYQRSQLLTYVIGVAFLRGIVLASRSVDLAGQIRSGELTKLLLQPLKIFNFWFIRDLTDKALNIFFATIEIIIVSKIVNFSLVLPKNSTDFVIFVVLVILSTLLYFYLSFFISVLAFWTEDVWATRWLLGIVLLELFAGAYFPIDILPSWLVRIIYWTPFPYLVFFPLKIWLGQASINMSIKIILISFCWLIFFFVLASVLWKKGVKNYGAFGG